MTTRIIITPDAKTGDLLFTMKTANREVFKAGIAELKQTVSPDDRSFSDNSKQWRITAEGRAGFDGWIAYMRSFHKAAVEWTDGGPETRREAKPSRAELYATLYLLPDAPQIVVKSAYRALAQFHHPDAGGTHEAMLKINDAYKQLAA
jgi:hypothetical protein